MPGLCQLRTTYALQTLSNGGLWEKQICEYFLKCLVIVICHWVPNIRYPTSQHVQTLFFISHGFFDLLNWKPICSIT